MVLSESQVILFLKKCYWWQRIACMGGIILLMLSAWLFFWYLPAWRVVCQKSMSIVELKKQYHLLEKKLQTLQGCKYEHEQLAQKLCTISDDLVLKKDPVCLFLELAHKHSLHCDVLQPQPEKQNAVCKKDYYHMQFRAPYRSVVDFLHKVSICFPSTKIKNMQLQKGQDGYVILKMGVRFLVVSNGTVV